VSVVQPDTAIFLDDHHGGGLHPAFVAARGLSSVERRHQTHREVP
jgi:hypothetical protein